MVAAAERSHVVAFESTEREKSRASEDWFFTGEAYGSETACFTTSPWNVEPSSGPSSSQQSKLEGSITKTVYVS